MALVLLAVAVVLIAIDPHVQRGFGLRRKAVREQPGNDFVDTYRRSALRIGPAFIVIVAVVLR